jgi:hypothetical protein
MRLPQVTHTTSSNMNNTFAFRYVKTATKGRLTGYTDNKESGRFIKQMK